MTSNLRPIFWLTTVFVCTIIAYANSFHGTFVHDDENDAILENDNIRTLWPVTTAMSLPNMGNGSSVDRRPLLSLSFAINYAISEYDPWSYHAVNLGIHLFSSLFLFGIIRRTLTFTQTKYLSQETAITLAGLITLLWAVHPLHTDSVTYIVQRAESLVGMFYLATLYCTLRGVYGTAKKTWLTLAVLSCAMGMASKEVMITAPLVVFLFDATLLEKSILQALRKRYLFYLCLTATASILLSYVYLTWTTPNGQDVAMNFRVRSPITYLLSQSSVILYYFRLAVWPHPLTMDYYWPLAKTPFQIAGPGLIIITLLGLTIWRIKKYCPFGFIGAFFFLVLAPTSSIVATMDLIQEHRLYLPLAALLTLGAITTHYYLFRFQKKFSLQVSQTAVTVLTVITTILFIALTFNRNTDYHDRLGFWKDAVEKRPQNPSALLNLAQEYAHLEQYDKVIPLLQQALTIPARNEGFPPDYEDIHFALAAAYEIEGKIPLAIDHLKKATTLNPNHAKSYYVLGSINQQHFRNFQKSRTYLKKSLLLDSFNPDAYSSLAEMAEAEGDLEQAIQFFEKASAQKPSSSDFQESIAKLYFKQKKYKLAKEHYQKALEIDPENTNAQNMLNSFF